MLELVYKRKIHVYETDLMGIVHHSNYLRFCEEARLFWCDLYLDKSNNIESESSSRFNQDIVFGLTVVETQVQHKFPLKYPTEFSILFTAKIHGATLHYDYKILDSSQNICAIVKTIHCSVNENLKPTRLHKKIIQAVEKYESKSKEK